MAIRRCGCTIHVPIWRVAGHAQEHEHVGRRGGGLHTFTDGGVHNFFGCMHMHHSVHVLTQQRRQGRAHHAAAHDYHIIRAVLVWLSTAFGGELARRQPVISNYIVVEREAAGAARGSQAQYAKMACRGPHAYTVIGWSYCLIYSIHTVWGFSRALAGCLQIFGTQSACVQQF